MPAFREIKFHGYCRKYFIFIFSPKSDRLLQIMNKRLNSALPEQLIRYCILLSSFGLCSQNFDEALRPFQFPWASQKYFVLASPNFSEPRHRHFHIRLTFLKNISFYTSFACFISYFICLYIQNFLN